MVEVTKKAVKNINRFLDIRMGILGAISMGAIVYFINIDHGMVSAFIAAAKQSIYTFFFGALFVKMAENLAAQTSNRLRAILKGGIIPALLTTLLTYCLHALKGTPEPFNSTVPTFVLGLMSFTTWSYLKHKSAFREEVEN